jgi:hypothetical protein
MERPTSPRIPNAADNRPRLSDTLVIMTFTSLPRSFSHSSFSFSRIELISPLFTMASIIRALRPLSRNPSVRLAGKRLAAGRPVQRYRLAQERMLLECIC